MHLRKYLVIVSISLVAVCACHVLAAQASTNGKQTIESLVHIFSNLKRVGNDQLDSSQLAQAAQMIDYSLMAERALGQTHWHALSQTQRELYLKNFRTLIEQRYYTRWHKIFAKSKLTYQSENQKGNDILVSSSITTGKTQKEIIWTLSDDAKVIDLTVDDKDLLDRLHDRFQTKLAQADLQSFINWLGKASKQADEESK